MFYNWKVLGIDEEKTKNDCKHSWWICQCSCEKQTIKSITKNNLKRGRSKSCGCNYIRAEEMIGKKYGKLFVLEIDESISHQSNKYVICKCDCGTIKSINSANLKNGKTISCGCITSKGEFLIKEILTSLKINFKQQYIFEDLKSNKDYKLRFDFGILDKSSSLICLIEFQGKQHYKINPAWQKEKDFLVQQENDELKRKYCQTHHIPLIEIPYWDLKKIDENYIKEKILCLL